MKIPMLTAAMFLASATALAMPPPPHRGGSGPGPCDCSVPSEIRALRQEIAALKLDKVLNLTADQAKKIQAIREKAMKRKAEIEREKKKREPNFIKAMTAVRDELKKTGTVSPETERALRLARGEIDFRELEAEFTSLLSEALEVLTEEQRASLEDFDPRPLSAHRGPGPHRMPPPPPPGGAPPTPGGMPPPPHGHFGPGPEGMPPGEMPPPPRHFRKRHVMNTATMLLSDEFEPMLKARLK